MSSLLTTTGMDSQELELKTTLTILSKIMQLGVFHVKFMAMVFECLQTSLWLLLLNIWVTVPVSVPSCSRIDWFWNAIPELLEGEMVSEGLINPSPTAHDASWNWPFNQLSCTDVCFFLNALKVSSLLKQWHCCCELRMMWKPGFGKQDSLTCILGKQDPLDSSCLCPRFQVGSFSCPSLYGCQVLFVFSSLRFCCYLWKSSRVYLGINYYQTASSISKISLHFLPSH